MTGTYLNKFDARPTPCCLQPIKWLEDPYCVGIFSVLKPLAQSRRFHDSQSSEVAFIGPNIFIQHQHARANKPRQIKQNSWRAMLGLGESQYENKPPHSTSEGVYIRQLFAANHFGWGDLPLNTWKNAKRLALIPSDQLYELRTSRTP